MDAYRETTAPAPLRAAVECVWRRQDDAPHAVVVVPDACVDLVWLEGRELQLVGPDTRARDVTTTGATAGIRWRPGAAGAFLRLPASEVLDRQVPASDLWADDARRLQDALRAAPDDAPRLLAAFVADRHVEPDPLVSAAARLLAAPGARTSSVADALGVSSRQLHRRVVAGAGYGPKVLARVLRLRRFQALAAGSLADRAVRSGYAHQPHLTDEVRALTGMTPVRFLEYLGRPAA